VDPIAEEKVYGLEIVGLLPKGTDRVPADLTVHTEAAVAKLGKFPPANPLTCKNAWKNKVKNRSLMEHAAGRNAYDWDKWVKGSRIQGFEQLA